MAKNYTPQWSEKDYTPFFLIDRPTHTEREIRIEYSRLRDIAMKRANRLEAAGLSEQADYIREVFPTLKEMQSIEQQRAETNKSLPARKRSKERSVADYLARGHSLIEERAYSLQGVKQLQKYISDETGEVIKIGDVLPFSQYMRSWRLSAFSQLLVPSEEAVDLNKEAYQEIGGSFSDFYTLYQQM